MWTQDQAQKQLQAFLAKLEKKKISKQLLGHIKRHLLTDMQQAYADPAEGSDGLIPAQAVKDLFSEEALGIQLIQAKADPAMREQISRIEAAQQRKLRDLAQNSPVLAKICSQDIVQWSQHWKPGGGSSSGSGGGGGDACDGRHWRRCERQRNREGRSQDFYKEVTDYLKDHPDDLDALMSLAQQQYDTGNMNGASAVAGQVLAQDPNNQGAQGLYQLSQKNGSTPALGAAAGQAVSIAADAANNPAAVGMDGSLGAVATPAQNNALSAADVPAPAVPVPAPNAVVALAALANSPNPAAAQVKSAVDMMRVGDMSAALPRLNQALQTDPNNPEALRLRAIAHARTGNYSEALRDAQASLQRAPKDPTQLLIKAFAKNKLKDYKGALEAADASLRVDPKSADALANYAYAVGGMGDRQRMMGLLEEAARQNPRYQASLQSARNQPADSDVLFLFPGEAAGVAAKAQFDSAQSPAHHARRWHWTPLAIISLMAVLLAALAVLQFVAPPIMTMVKTALTRGAHAHPAVVDMPEMPAAALQPTLAADIMAGRVLLKDQYKILRRIGEGGMGLVYEGLDMSLGRSVAVKKMREELRSSRHDRARFINEAKLLAALHHPNIVDIYAILEEGDEVYLIFEFVNGKTVHDIISARGVLGFPAVLGISRHIGAALDFAHAQGVVHRDLKPANVMVSAEGFVKVMDFGIARLAQDAVLRMAMTNTVMGTPPYMSPEQEQGVVRREADIYSLGICVYEMLSGKAPFCGSGAGMLANKINMTYVPISKFVKGLPAGIDTVFVRAFQADPDKRFASAREFVAALEALPS